MKVPETIITYMDGHDGSLGAVVTRGRSNNLCKYIYTTSVYVNDVPLTDFGSRRDSVYHEHGFLSNVNSQHSAGVRYLAGREYRFARCFTRNKNLPEPEAVLVVDIAYASQQMYCDNIAVIADAVATAYHENPVRPLSLIVPFSVAPDRFDQLSANTYREKHPDFQDVADWSVNLLSPAIKALGLPELELTDLHGDLEELKIAEVFALTEEWLPDSADRGPYAFVARFAA